MTTLIDDNQIIEFVKFAENQQPKALQMIKREGFVFDNTDDNPWQKLAFTLYNRLCEINLNARNLLEYIEDLNGDDNTGGQL